MDWLMKIKKLSFVVVLTLASVALINAGEPQVNLTKSKGIYNLTGEFVIQMPPQLIWNVLTDYSQIPSFVSVVEHSSVEKLSPDTFIMDQTTKGTFFVFSKKIRLLLKIKEDPITKLSFTDLSKEDFHVYEGNWQIQEIGKEGYKVQYELSAKPAFFSPGFITRGAFQTGVKEYMEEVRLEINRRGLAAAPKDPATQAN